MSNELSKEPIVATLTDNGLRCFVPPCFQWDVIDENGIKVASVSSIKIAGDFATGVDWQAIVSNGLKVIGRLEEYRVENGADGVVFIVESLIGG